MMKPPVVVGERLVVYGRHEKAIVSKCEWLTTEARWRIDLDWGEFGTSRVYDTDEGKVWYRYARAS